MSTSGAGGPNVPNGRAALHPGGKARALYSLSNGVATRYTQWSGPELFLKPATPEPEELPIDILR
jgi:hypothetical protein